MAHEILKLNQQARTTAPAKTEKRQLTAEEKRASRRNLSVLAVLILLMLGVAALANWRSLKNSGAASSIGFGASSRSAAAAVVATPPALPANRASKEYIYAGSALLNTVEPFREVPDEFAVWRPTNGVWYILNIVNNQQQAITTQWGAQNDIPSPGDFDGDGKADFCVFRPSNSNWFIINSSTGAISGFAFGSQYDIPAVADYDGDGRADVAVFRPSNGTWHMMLSSNNQYATVTFGQSDDLPRPADFDGDGKADFAVWRPGSSPKFWVKQTSVNPPNDVTSSPAFVTGDVPVVGDYDGDGRADYATFRPGDNVWRILYSSGASPRAEQWGLSSDKLVPGDYDRDGKTDIAVWRPGNGVWYVLKSSNNSLWAVQFGESGDYPVPAPYRRAN
ncbi:MAG TPA: VCBS repeat-containing protein [Pyrinomonadaceae bacterium]